MARSARCASAVGYARHSFPLPATAFALRRWRFGPFLPHLSAAPCAAACTALVLDNLGRRADLRASGAGRRRLLCARASSHVPADGLHRRARSSASQQDSHLSSRVKPPPPSCEPLTARASSLGDTGSGWSKAFFKRVPVLCPPSASHTSRCRYGEVLSEKGVRPLRN